MLGCHFFKMIYRNSLLFTVYLVQLWKLQYQNATCCDEALHGLHFYYTRIFFWKFSLVALLSKRTAQQSSGPDIYAHITLSYRDFGSERSPWSFILGIFAEIVLVLKSQPDFGVHYIKFRKLRIVPVSHIIIDYFLCSLDWLEIICIFNMFCAVSICRTYN